MIKLQERVRPEGHPDLKGALVIASKHLIVNKNNERCLSDLNTDLIVVEAINSHANLPNFKPKIDKKKGTVSSTCYLQTLKPFVIYTCALTACHVVSIQVYFTETVCAKDQF